MSEERTVNECYQYNRDTRSYIEAVEERHDKKFDEIRGDIKSIDLDIKELVKMLANRLPVWATLFISFLMCLVGGLLAKVVWR